MGRKETTAASGETISADLAAQIQEQARLLDQVAQALQKLQNTLPAPSIKEVSTLRRGGPLSIAAYLIGLVQRAIVSVENAASDLTTGLDEETLSCLDTMRPSAVEINAIESAMNERLQQRP